MLSPRALVRGNPARAKFAAENMTKKQKRWYPVKSLQLIWRSRPTDFIDTEMPDFQMSCSCNDLMRGYMARSQDNGHQVKTQDWVPVQNWLVSNFLVAIILKHDYLGHESFSNKGLMFHGNLFICISLGWWKRDMIDWACHLVAIAGTTILVPSHPFQVTAIHLKTGYQ